MAKIISGYAEGGGSAERRNSLLQRASEDLEAKLDGAKVQALAIHSDDTGLHLIAACEGDSEKKPGATVSKQKGGK